LLSNWLRLSITIETVISAPHPKLFLTPWLWSQCGVALASYFSDARASFSSGVLAYGVMGHEAGGGKVMRLQISFIVCQWRGTDHASA